MGLDMYLSAKQRIEFENRDQYFAIQNLFGTFTTKQEKDLDVSFYISGWHKDKSAEQAQFQGIIDLFNLEGFVPDSSPSGNVFFGGCHPLNYIDVSMHVAYWRKANQIHQWFVDNVQGGEDECRPHEASREQLEALLRTCRRVLGRTDLEPGEVHVGTMYTSEGVEHRYEDGKVISEPALAQELLPTQGGFFFGGTDYDEWYVQNLEETVAQIEKALALAPEWTFVYQSSW